MIIPQPSCIGNARISRVFNVLRVFMPKNNKIPDRHKNDRQNALYCVILGIIVVRENVVDKSFLWCIFNQNILILILVVVGSLISTSVIVFNKMLMLSVIVVL